MSKKPKSTKQSALKCAMEELATLKVSYNLMARSTDNEIKILTQQIKRLTDELSASKAETEFSKRLALSKCEEILSLLWVLNIARVNAMASSQVTETK